MVGSWEKPDHMSMSLRQLGLRSRGSYWDDRGFLSGGELERSRYLKGRPPGAVIVICMQGDQD